MPLEIKREKTEKLMWSGICTCMTGIRVKVDWGEHCPKYGSAVSITDK